MHSNANIDMVKYYNNKISHFTDCLYFNQINILINKIHYKQVAMSTK